MQPNIRTPYLVRGGRGKTCGHLPRDLKATEGEPTYRSETEWDLFGKLATSVELGVNVFIATQYSLS